MMRYAPFAIAAGVLIAFTLSACASRPPPEPIVRVVETRVPIPVPCNPRLGTPPAYPDTDAAIEAATDIFDLAKLYRAGRGLRSAWIAELEAALAGCRG